MLQTIKDSVYNYYPLMLLLLIGLIPTALHFTIINAGYTSPHFIKTVAINTWFKLIVGVGAGIGIGFLVNKKFDKR